MGVETRVFAIESNSIDEGDFINLTDNRFIDMAEEQGTVWSISGFQQAFNECTGEIDTNTHFIRFIDIVVEP